MKKIIAREGLIILSIALLASCLLLTIAWFDDKASEILEPVDDETYIAKVMEKEIDISKLSDLTVPEYIELARLDLEEYNYQQQLRSSDREACTGEKKEQCQLASDFFAEMDPVHAIKTDVERHNDQRQKEHTATYSGYASTTFSIFSVVLFLYPLYLIIRFIIWAICTLRRT